MIDFSKITEQKISEKYNSLPQDLKDILSSINTSTAIENIAARYRLDEEKTTMLIQLVGLVILGFVSFENMKEEMKEIIDISPQFIPLIADEIRQKIFSPVINSLQKIITEKRPPAATPATPAPTTPKTTSPTPPYQGGEKREVASPTPTTDQYRELTPSVPEIIDLRKMPLPSAPPAPITPVPKIQVVPLTPAPAPSLPPKPTTVPPILTSPLTFTRPVEPVKPAAPTQPITPKPVKPVELIEAEPHKPPASAPKPAPTTPRPQYIMRPSGAPPTDSPENVLDLRKDKGEF